MKKLNGFLLTLVIALVLVVGNADAQFAKLNKSVVGSGGSVGLQNSSGVTLNGVTGQFAIGTLTNAIPGSNSQNLNQGFWVPEPKNLTGVNDEPISSNENFFNYPNPVSNSTTFQFTLTEASEVSLKIYDMVGNLVKTVYQGYEYAGTQKISWDGKADNGLALQSGSYLYELQVSSSNMAGRSAYDNYVMRNVLVIVR